MLPGYVQTYQQGHELDVYLFHAMIGSVNAYYRDIVPKLPPAWSIHGFTSPGLFDESPRLESIRAMAQAYVRHIRATRRAERVLLVGFCCGGLTAYETAGLLAGEADTDLALIDSNLTLYKTPGRRAYLRQSFWTMLSEHLHRTTAWQVPNGGARFWSLTKHEKLAYLHDSCRQLERRTAADVERLHGIFWGNWNATQRFRPRDYAGPVAYFLPHQSTTPEGLDRWRVVAGQQLEVYRLPGNHFTCIRDPLAQHIADVLIERASRRKARHENADR